MSLFGLYILGHSALTEANTGTQAGQGPGVRQELKQKLWENITIGLFGTLWWYHPQ